MGGSVIQAQELAEADTLRQPSDVPINGRSLSDFLAAHSQSVTELLSGNADPENREDFEKQLERKLRQRNFARNWIKEEDLSGINLSGRDLRFINLKEATLVGTSFEKSNLRGANLKEANLTRANLRSARLQKANLKEATLREADLTHANLEGANLKEIDCPGCKFQDANLRNAILPESFPW